MTAVEEDIDDRFAGIDIDSLLNRVDRRPRSYGRKPYLYEAPEFTRRLNGEETVMEGQSLCLDCKVIGFPAPSLRWFKDDEEIVDHPRIRVESDGKGNYSLFIDKVNKGDEAAYRCRAENVEGSSSCYFFLSVRCKPKSKKKRDKNAAKKRNVSFPPMFSTIVEKVEEEDKLGKEQEILPPSPMTQFYYALTLKGRQTWPSFLGDWAFRYESDIGKGEDDTTLNDNDDVFENDNSSKTPVFYIDDEDESGEPKNKKTKKQAKTPKSNEIEANKENVSAKPYCKPQQALKPDTANRDDSNKNVTSESSASDIESKLTNRICLHSPLRKEDDSRTAKENAGAIVSPGIFLEYAENDEEPPHAFQREEREPTPFFKANRDGKENESPFCNKLQPVTATESAAFEREPTPFFDKTKGSQSYYLEEVSSSESSPDREVEAIGKARSQFLTVPTKPAFTFEGPVRAPRDSTPTPFQENELFSDAMLDNNTPGLRPPRESTPFFPKEEDNGPDKDVAEDLLSGSTDSPPGKDISAGRNRLATNQCKTKTDLPLPKEDDVGDKGKHNKRHSFDQTDRKKQRSPDTTVDKTDRGKGEKFSHLLRYQAKTTGNVQKPLTAAKPQRQPGRLVQQGDNVSDNSNNYTKKLSRDSKVSNLSRFFQEKPDNDKARKVTSDMSTHTNNNSVSELVTQANKKKLHESTCPSSKPMSGAEKAEAQMSSKSNMSSSVSELVTPVNKKKLPESTCPSSNHMSDTENADAQVSSKSNTSFSSPIDTKTSNSSMSSVAARKAAAAQARKELYRQRKLKEEQAKIVEAKGTFSPSPAEEAAQSQTSGTNSKTAEVHKDESNGQDSKEPNFNLHHRTAVQKPNKQSVIQSSLPLPNLDQNLLTSTQSDQAATTAPTTNETTIKSVPNTPATVNSSMSNANAQRLASASKSSEPPKPTKLTISSPTSLKTITPATSLVKPPLSAAVPLAKSMPLTSPQGNLKHENRSPSPKPSTDSFTMPSPKPQDRIDSSTTSKKTVPCTPTQLPSLMLQNVNVNHPPEGMRPGTSDLKPKRSPTRPKMPSSSTTATKPCNGNSEGEKKATRLPSLANKSFSSTSSKTTGKSALAQSKSPPNVPVGMQSSRKATKGEDGEHMREKNVSHKISKVSNSATPTHTSPTRLCESFNPPHTSQQGLPLPPEPTILYLTHSVPFSPVTGIQNRMPICHRLEKNDKCNKFKNTARKASQGIVFERQEQNNIYSTLWSKFQKAFMNSFFNEVPQSKEEIRKHSKRLKVVKSKDSSTSKGKSKLSRGKSYKDDWTKVSPFGKYTLEGVFLVCLITLIGLSADVRVEVFICYILAAYYTFFVLRVLKLLD